MSVKIKEFQAYLFVSLWASTQKWSAGKSAFKLADLRIHIIFKYENYILQKVFSLFLGNVFKPA